MMPLDNNQQAPPPPPPPQGGGVGGMGGGGGGGRQGGTPMLREQDQYMPIANVIRIMRRILPPHAKISDDAKETVQECVSEYISFVTGEANERCQREQRKTVTAEDVIWAMGKLGFDNYVDPLSLFLARYRENEGDRSGFRDPLLYRRTMAAAAAAAAAGHHHDVGSSSSSSASMMMPLPNMNMAPPLPPLLPNPAPAPQQHPQGVSYLQGFHDGGQGMYGGGVLDGYYKDPFGTGEGEGSGGGGGGGGGEGGGCTHDELANFDMFSQFK
ncbi:Nuclear transcription factor Y subunit B-9 [Linum perenne]